MQVRGQSFSTSIRILLHHPRLLLTLLTGDFDKVYCSYWAMKLKDAKKIYDEYVKARSGDTRQLIDELKVINNMLLSRSYGRIEAFYIPLYALVRFSRPETAVETGVHRGVSSLFILQAMADNNSGLLYSIDLPHAQYQSDSGAGTKSVLQESKIGICVPDYLRHRWKLILGDSRKELPALLAERGEIGMFLHDSEHTYDHMMWEFQTAWPSIKANGFLLSDDIHWSRAFTDFAAKVQAESWELYRDRQSLGTGKFGIILKS